MFSVSSVVSLGIVSDGSFISEDLDKHIKTKRKIKTNKATKGTSYQKPKIQIQIFPDSDDDFGEKKRERYIGNLLNEYSDLRSDRAISEQNSDISIACSDIKKKPLTVKKSKKRGTTDGERFDIPNIQFDIESVESDDNGSVLSDNQSILSDLTPSVKLTKTRNMADRSRQQSEISSEEVTYSRSKETKLTSKETGFRNGSDLEDEDFNSVGDHSSDNNENVLNKMAGAKNEMGNFEWTVAWILVLILTSYLQLI